MDSKELAQKMLEWGGLMEAAALLEKEIEQAVLEIGKTQTVGNVRATFSNPRKSYQSWEDAIAEAEPEGLDPESYKVVSVSYDWKKAAGDFGIERKTWLDPDAKPSVKVKVI